MFDPNIKDFYERVGRLKSAHAAGLGFEAAGALGRSHYRRPKAKTRGKVLLPIIFMICAGFAMKGAIHYYVGAQTYENRVTELKQGEGFDKLGSLLMAPDRVTLWVSHTLRRNLNRHG